MCETLKWIKLLVVESQKDGLQIPVKISLGEWSWATQEFLFRSLRNETVLFAVQGWTIYIVICNIQSAE